MSGASLSVVLGLAALGASACAATSAAFGQVSPPSETELAAAFPDLGGVDARELMPGDPVTTLVLLDRFETRDGGDGPTWDLLASAGRDLDKLLVRSEGERQAGATEHAELELLWAHAIAPWWDLVAGLRQSLEPGPSQRWAAIGVQGLSPYEFEVEATAYFAAGGRASARLEAEYELLITQRLILQPRIELEWHAQDDIGRRVGAGLARLEAGLRLRYEIRREIAPYLGIARSRAFGDTADLAMATGRDPDDTHFVAGLRVWF